MLEMYLNTDGLRSSMNRNTTKDIYTAFYNRVVEELQGRLQKTSGITDTTEQYTRLRQLIIDGCAGMLKRRYGLGSSNMENSFESSGFASEGQGSKYIPRIDKVERKLEKVLSKLEEAGQDDDDDDEDDGRSRFPNLKYA